jgi:hypothetical protein
MGYFGFLAGPPFIGFTAQLLGLRCAFGVIVATSLLIVMLAPAVGRGWSSAKGIFGLSQVGRSPAKSGKVLLMPPVLQPDSHMNDLRVDLTHGAQGTAYVADSSFGTTPALIVVDLATLKARWRRLVMSRRHPVTPF